MQNWQYKQCDSLCYVFWSQWHYAVLNKSNDMSDMTASPIYFDYICVKLLCNKVMEKAMCWFIQSILIISVLLCS